MSLGIESGSDKVLKSMKKHTTVKKVREGVNLIRSTGIDVAGFFIMGFTGETPDDTRKTMRLSLDLDLIRANYFTYLPFPGSTSYNELAAKGELGNVDWDEFYFMNAAYVPKGISRKELRTLHRLAFFGFFFRRKILWKNLKGIRSLRHFKYLLKRYFHWIIMR